MAMITDIQILSYYYKGKIFVPGTPIYISSTTAAEFLLIQSKVPHKANYYPILQSRLWRHVVTSASTAVASLRMLINSKKHAAIGKHRTDQLVLDFGAKAPSYVEFGNLAITQIINEGHELLFTLSIAHLDKGVQKMLKDRLRFLLETKVQCIAVNHSVATIGMNLLSRFLDRYQAKQNTRNTINDVLVLATAIAQSSPLHTEDNLLRRFAADVMGVTCHEQLPVGLSIDFGIQEVHDRRKPLESKGYVNRGWQILERRAR